VTDPTSATPNLPPLLRKASDKLSGWMVMVILGAVVLVVMLTCLSTTFTRWQRSKYGALQLAANDGDVAKLVQLLQAGADVNERCAFRNWTALHAAADRGQAAAARVLLEHGAKVDLKDGDGFTPLHVTGSQPSGKAQPKAGEAGRNEVALLLLDHGANANATTHHGDNALHCAVVSNNATLVKILLEHGADPTHRDDDGYTPVDLAGFRKDEAVLSAFQAFRSPSGQTP